MKKIIGNSSGQIVIILLLIALVGLAIGLAITQRSVTDLTTSTQTDQASRAFSAAEAGLEKALSEGTGFTNFSLGNDAQVDVKVSNSLPTAAGQAIEYPPVGKDDIAQVWLVNPGDLSAVSNPAEELDIFFGDVNSTTTIPAIEVKIIKNNAGVYTATNYYIDPDDAATGRRTENGFVDNNRNCPAGGCSVNTILSPNSTDANRLFKYRHNIDLTGGGTPIMARIRLLYSDTNQPIAVQPISGNLPAQILIYTSQGIAGQSRKVVQSVRQQFVVSPLFDYAIFSSTTISK